ncbi:DMT family transporter [Vibrio sp. ZSDE26]|uniref:DMT family transporter n=1 Tax=Vibrio amylolyticus TaxID=2847292 RepID=A0A9X1XL57_9VIBR|nr:DMT family transporter [Vibrio amylolyticus]MCK6263743.1 DMT family transporter [Vibrio amylolyticus]
MPIYLVTFITMVAFAANSLLCRVALAHNAIDPGSFTILRIISGMCTLVIIHFIARRFLSSEQTPSSSLLPTSRKHFVLLLCGSLTLFLYAIAFSFAYIELTAGAGALLLFGAVQLTMIGFHIWQGNALNRNEWLGLGLSISGFVLLMLPSASAPDFMSAIMMIFAGISWAVFTLLGKRKSVTSPRVGMTQSFIGAAGIVLFLSPWTLKIDSITFDGAMWAVLSGVLASGMGYVLWYYVLTKLSVLKASVAQLSVPIIALFLGMLLLDEALSLTVVITSVMILGGILLIFLNKESSPAK